jgi:hypothetical protein
LSTSKPWFSATRFPNSVGLLGGFLGGLPSAHLLSVPNPQIAAWKEGFFLLSLPPGRFPKGTQGLATGVLMKHLGTDSCGAASPYPDSKLASAVPSKAEESKPRGQTHRPRTYPHLLCTAASLSTSPQPSLTGVQGENKVVWASWARPRTPQPLVHMGLSSWLTYSSPHPACTAPQRRGGNPHARDNLEPVNVPQ